MAEKNSTLALIEKIEAANTSARANLGDGQITASIKIEDLDVLLAAARAGIAAPAAGGSVTAEEIAKAFYVAWYEAEHQGLKPVGWDNFPLANRTHGKSFIAATNAILSLLASRGAAGVSPSGGRFPADDNFFLDKGDIPAPAPERATTPPAGETGE